MSARRRRTRRVLGIIAGSVAAVLVLAVAGFVIWANNTYPAEPEALAEVAHDERVMVAERDGVIVMSPSEQAMSEQAEPSGLVFFAGAKVEPEAYAATFRETVAAGQTVVIVQSLLNLPLFETRPLSDFTSLAPEVDSWAVGGHSMGGVKACMFADSEPEVVEALVLFASYCADDSLASRDDLVVLSLSATNDGLATPEKIEASIADLPERTRFEAIEGAVHAQFGAYGEQPGDGTPTISDEQARVEITKALEALVGA
ncbi:alpha/beta hydrolase [Leucobacter sp. NPDC077196]|uniref:alpha/beta hydrolase n=1 Tax=Leucobacter sp. NPDC077196 TaxID=3154959 RepID=UPI00343D0F0F